MNRPLVVVVSKRSMYERFIQDRRDPKAISLFQRHDISVARWRKAHLAHQLTLRRVLQTLRALGAKVTVLRSPGAVFDASDAILAGSPDLRSWSNGISEKAGYALRMAAVCRRFSPRIKRAGRDEKKSKRS